MISIITFLICSFFWYIRRVAIQESRDIRIKWNIHLITIEWPKLAITVSLLGHTAAQAAEGFKQFAKSLKGLQITYKDD